MDLQDSVYRRTLFFSGPTRFEDDVNDILTGITVEELRHRVLDCLVLF